MAGVTLDAGPLILLDKGKEVMSAWLKVAHDREEEISTPAVVVAEVWRPGPRSARLARALAGFAIVDVDEQMGKQAGELLSHLRHRDRAGLTVDALVVASAKRRGDFVLTTDPSDVGALAKIAGVEVRTP